jgi:hypothetical protein
MSNRSLALRQSRHHHRPLVREASVIYAMRRDGLSLHLERRPRGDCWTLSDGTLIPSTVAVQVIENPSIISCGGALFAGIPGQTYRYINGDDR